MEVASSLHPQPTNGTNLNPSMIDSSMDIDMDLDLGPLPEPEPEHVGIQAQVPSVTAEEAVASSHLNEEPQFEKVHIRGVDELTTEDLKRYSSEHFVTEELTRIEWIDDTSANLVYSCTDIGLQALATFSQQNPEEDPSPLHSLRLRTAKSLSTHPESVLQVRTAVKTDRKRQRAHESSRFYLMHPEHDPRERMRREFADRRRSGRRDDSESDYTRRRFDDREHRRRRGRANEENLSESMYDDDGGRSRERSGSNEGRLNGDRGRDRSRRDRRDTIELFPDDGPGSSGRLRDRSASPLRMEFDQDSTLDSRERTRKSFRNRSPRNSRSRDLMSRANEYATIDDGSGRPELFPNKTTSSYLKRELFPKKSTSSNHRRSDAFDAADETADLFPKHMPVPLMDGASGGEASGRSTGPVELFPDKSDNNGMSIHVAASEDQGISIRGAAQGISIKGAASVRELFPSKYNSNEGKELFSDKLQGRGGKRRKAEDMFS
ncbi:uncharacterized protein BDCG_01514 [Blastomyces dermatitidis ER-3]|uniref:Uncharacterized protein n=1 Tax=Ajellomyces dermatitidis (strain ER-3 / ATCC MYA-2586) TaxID=559297 RepID=A0ABX2VSU4_AJEDR|nr:uncharacterized protein BDCG_01514 [Blastomyces dermatitidis ER-3]EQL30690.1 hypothetical protein BDFG_06842 [Blastomyces dermatitidis ATCC 26199]OAS99895.1 hypothetical protein BDCG_01514 [Blastomyces dermatitidis ER-3]